MKMLSQLQATLYALLLVSGTIAFPWNADTNLNSRSFHHDNDGPGFTYNRTHFLLNGSPYQMIGGQMDPQRIPRAYWSDRLKMARAMGLNTILSYIYWNKLEPKEGEWDFTDNNDIATYFKLAQEEGLNIVLRPGPYVCGEVEWGGFPAWLNTIDGMVVRSNNEPFLNYADIYLTKLAEQVGSLQATTGGPILMVQLENEYGFYGDNTADDKAYLTGLATSLRKNFQVPIYSNDGGSQGALDIGGLPGVLAETDGDPKVGFPARDQYVNDTSRLGPQLCGEYYVTWIDKWASDYSHQTDTGNSTAEQKVLDDLEYVLSAGNSISFYMVHGGTNWGFNNGGSWENNAYTVVTTSYDYGAPIDESGRPSEIYTKIRDVISKYVPEGSIPEIPQKPSRAAFDSIDLKPVGEMFTTPGGSSPTAQSDSPQNMEALGQSYGFTLYEHKATAAHDGAVQPW